MNETKTTINEVKKKTPAPQYPGRELIRAAKGVNRDLLAALLEPEKRYTEAQVNALVEQALNKEVVTDARR